MKENDLTIGRIKPALEKALGLTFPGDRKLYVEEATLSSIVARKGDSYLHYLEEVKEIIDHPDFVSFEQKKEELCFYRLYHRNGFLVVGVSFSPQGIPRGWCLKEVKRHPNAEGTIARIG